MLYKLFSHCRRYLSLVFHRSTRYRQNRCRIHRYLSGITVHLAWWADVCDLQWQRPICRPYTVERWHDIFSLCVVNSTTFGWVWLTRICRKYIRSGPAFYDLGYHTCSRDPQCLQNRSKLYNFNNFSRKDFDNFTFEQYGMFNVTTNKTNAIS